MPDGPSTVQLSSSAPTFTPGSVAHVASAGFTGHTNTRTSSLTPTTADISVASIAGASLDTHSYTQLSSLAPTPADISVAPVAGAHDPEMAASVRNQFGGDWATSMEGLEANNNDNNANTA